MFSAILTDAFQDCDDCFSIRYRVDGILFNLRLQAKSNIQMSFSMLTVLQRMFLQRRGKRLWIEFHKPVTAMNTKLEGTRLT